MSSSIRPSSLNLVNVGNKVLNRFVEDGLIDTSLENSCSSLRRLVIGKSLIEPHVFVGFLWALRGEAVLFSQEKEDGFTLIVISTIVSLVDWKAISCTPSLGSLGGWPLFKG